MELRRYLEIIATIGYVGKPLRTLETELSQKWGITTKAVWFYINKLRKEGLVKYQREWKRGPIRVVPTPELKEIIANIEKEWSPTLMKRYVKA